MMTDFSQLTLANNVNHARKLIEACERDLGYELDAGQIGDLLSDKTFWSREDIDKARDVIIADRTMTRVGEGEQNDA